MPTFAPMSGRHTEPRRQSPKHPADRQHREQGCSLGNLDTREGEVITDQIGIERPEYNTPGDEQQQ
jgi:hypothetical protein